MNAISILSFLGASMLLTFLPGPNNLFTLGEWHFVFDHPIAFSVFDSTTKKMNYIQAGLYAVIGIQIVLS